MTTTDKKTLVEEGTQLTGTMTSTCPVVVNGTIDGEFSAPELTVTKSGAVLGSIKVKKLQSQGTLSGDVEADEVYLAGVVKPATVIKATSLEVKLASATDKKLEVTFGECVLEVGDEPGKVDRPKPAKGASKKRGTTPSLQAAAEASSDAAASNDEATATDDGMAEGSSPAALSNGKNGSSGSIHPSVRPEA